MTATPPSPGPRIDRSRLLSALEHSVEVTVLRAPAGFGKTTLLRQWAESSPDVVRVSMQDPRHGTVSPWSRIAAALAAVGRGTTAEIGDGSPRDVVIRLLTSAGPTTLALDDIDTLDRSGGSPGSRIPDEALLHLLRACPGLRLVLAGRGSSWLPDDLLTRLEARVIGPDELAFTREETTELLDRTVPCLNHHSSYWAEQVQDSTGGWPEITAEVARRMAMAAPDPIELASIASRTAAEHLRPRLVAELERLTGTELASATAVTDRFSADLAAAVTGQPDAGTALVRFVDDGLLISETVGSQTFYRWPQAARAVLLEELTVRDPGAVERLHGTWARHCLRHNQPRQALLHARAAQDWPLLISIVDTAWRTLLFGDNREVREALAAAPAEVVATSSRACALREILLFSPGMPCPPPIQQPLTPCVATASSTSVANLARLASAAQLTEVFDSGLLVVAAHRHRGRHAEALADARRLHEVADIAQLTRPTDVAPHRPAIHLALGVGLLLTSDLPGAETALELAYRHGLAAVGAHGPVKASGAASMLAMIHALRGDATIARLWLDRVSATDVAQAAGGRPVTHLHVASAVAGLLIAVDESDAEAADAANHRLALLDPASPWLDLWAFACYAQAQYALHHGDVHAALDRVARVRATHRHDLGDDGIAVRLLASAEANLLIAAGRANPAQRCLRLAGKHGLLRVPAARLALLSGDTAEAARLASDIGWESTAGTRDRVEMRLIRAIAARRAGDLPLARTLLDRAVRSAREAGLHSAWATVPAAELHALGHRGMVPEQSLRAPAAAFSVYPDSVLIVELTEREQDVLNGLATGATLERVAATLTISYNTVKTHVASIYRKLHVDSREDAIGEALRLGLLEPAPR